MICPACRKSIPLSGIWHKHHKFHNTKWARKLYGTLLDDRRNIDDVCGDCNTSHAGIGLVHWTEKNFCEALGIEMRSKVKI